MEKNIAKFLYEMSHMRHVKHEGWRMIGVEHVESIAEHSLCAAQIAFVLATMEKHPDPCRVCAMVVFHDMAETRVGDIHKVANRYVTADEERAAQEQMEPLGEMGRDILSLWTETENRSTEAGIIAKDADLLDMALMAKKYTEEGRHFAQDWIKNVSNALRTESAKSLLKALQETHSNDWWQGLKKLGK